MDDVLLEIAKQFNTNAVSIEFLTKCRNTIYKVNCEDYTFILRVSDDQHRDAGQIKSELDFQKYLYNNGAAVAKPLQTEIGDSCLRFEMGSSNFIGSAFEYIEGAGLYESKNNSEETFVAIGNTVIDFDECEYSWFAADLAICIRAYLFWTENPAALPTKADEAEMMHYNAATARRT